MPADDCAGPDYCPEIKSGGCCLRACSYDCERGDCGEVNQSVFHDGLMLRQNSNRPKAKRR
jgi:hypothetical protein